MKSESAPLPRSALLALQRATHATLHLIATELVDLDLTASEINALANLPDGQGRTVSQLGAAIGAAPPRSPACSTGSSAAATSPAAPALATAARC